METDNLRITKLREYLIGVIGELKESFGQVNVDYLSSNVDNYSIDKIPTSSVVEAWITGDELHRDVYNFRSRMNYSADTISNIENIGFFELFEKKIFDKNWAKQLPDIEGIQSIRCLNCASVRMANTNTAEFSIQIQIEYGCRRGEDETNSNAEYSF